MSDNADDIFSKEAAHIFHNTMIHFVSNIISAMTALFFVSYYRNDTFSLISIIIFFISSLLALIKIKSNQNALFDIKHKLMKERRELLARQQMLNDLLK